MSVLATDDFNRADSSGSLGANWTNNVILGSLSIVSNAAKAVSAGFVSNYYSAVSFPDDQYSQAVATTIQDAAVTVREGSTSFYMFYRGAANFFIYYYDGSFHQLSDLGAGGSNGDTMKLEVHSSTLKGFVNGTQFGSDVIDTNLTSGSPGILGYGPSSSILDNWEGGDFNVASTVKQLAALGVG